MSTPLKHLLSAVSEYITATLTEPLEQYKPKATELLTLLATTSMTPLGRVSSDLKFTIQHWNGATEHFTGWEELATRLAVTVDTARVRMSQRKDKWQRTVQCADTGNPTYYTVLRDHIGSPSPSASLPNLAPPPKGRRDQVYDLERLGTEFQAPVRKQRESKKLQATKLVRRKTVIPPGTVNKANLARMEERDDRENIYVPFTGERDGAWFINDVRKTKSQYDEEIGTLPAS